MHHNGLHYNLLKLFEPLCDFLYIQVVVLMIKGLTKKKKSHLLARVFELESHRVNF